MGEPEHLEWNDWTREKKAVPQDLALERRTSVRLMMFAEITFCPSINLEQPVIVLILFLTSVSAKLWNTLPDFIRTDWVTGFKMRIQAEFCIAAFFKNVYFFKYFIISYLSVIWAMYFICKCNVWKILVLVITLKFEIKESLHLLWSCE